MGLSKLSEKYWKGGETFAACVSQIFSREKNDRFGESVSQLYSERKTYDATSVFVALCCSVHMRSFLSRLKGEVDHEIAHPET